MAGMDIAVVKKLTYGKMALMGNVQCDLLQDGPKEAIRQSVLYCLEHGAPGGGYRLEEWRLSQIASPVKTVRPPGEGIVDGRG